MEIEGLRWYLTELMQYSYDSEMKKNQQYSMENIYIYFHHDPVKVLYGHSCSSLVKETSLHLIYVI